MYSHGHTAAKSPMGKEGKMSKENEIQESIIHVQFLKEQLYESHISYLEKMLETERKVTKRLEEIIYSINGETENDHTN
jgi:hypothetical protein